MHIGQRKANEQFEKKSCRTNDKSLNLNKLKNTPKDLVEESLPFF